MHEMYPDQLWQGNLLEALDEPADVVLSCTSLSSLSAVRPRKLHLLFPFDDIAELPDMIVARQLAEICARQIAMKYTMLVNCDLGHNRSAFMVALILMSLGIRGVVDYVKARNPNAFTKPGDGGPFFADYLNRIGS